MTNSKIGKSYRGEHLKNVPDETILVEAALRRGQPLTTLIKPSTPSTGRVDLAKWKNAVAAAKNADYPNRNLLLEVYDNIEIDTTLTSLMETRILTAQQRRFVIKGKDGKVDFEKTKLFQTLWFYDFIGIAMMKTFRGTRLIELWNFNEKGEIMEVTEVDEYHVKPKQGIVTKDVYDDFGYDYLNGPNSLFYIPVGKPKDLGLLLKIAPFILAKKYAIGTWGEYNEKQGIPFRVVRTPINDKVRQQQLAVIMENMGSAGWAVLNENEKMELLAMAGSDPTRCFESFIKKMDDEVAMAIAGQTMTSNSQNNKGTYGSMKVLQEISKDRHEADCTSLKALVNGMLIPRMIQYGYDLVGCEYDWDQSVQLTVNETVDYVIKLSDVYDIPSEWVTEKTGIPIIGTKKQPQADPPKVPVVKKKSLAGSINAFYEANCCDHTLPQAAKQDSKFDSIVADVAKRLFEGKQSRVVDMALLKHTATQLREAIVTGYGKTPEDKDFDVRDFEMLKHLERNVYVFSGFKTYQQLREATDLLRDKDGNVRSWPDYKTEVLKNSEKYNVRYLKAEYDHALVSSQMASQWIDIQRNKDILPLLEFDATLDMHTTNTCRSLDGMRLPCDHPVWKTYYLPLHFGERSLIRQVARGTISDTSKIDFPELKPMFKNNVGIDGVAFPDTHPYYEASKADKKEIEAAVKKATPKSLQEEFSELKKGKKKIEVSNFVKPSEKKYNQDVAFLFADKFDTKVLGHFKDKVSPDLKLGTSYADVKTPTGDTLEKAIKSSIKNALNQRWRQEKNEVPKTEQITSMIIDIRGYDYDEEMITNAIKTRFKSVKSNDWTIYIVKGKGQIMTTKAKKIAFKKL